MYLFRSCVRFGRTCNLRVVFFICMGLALPYFICAYAEVSLLTKIVMGIVVDPSIKIVVLEYIVEFCVKIWQHFLVYLKWVKRAVK